MSLSQTTQDLLDYAGLTTDVAVGLVTGALNEDLAYGNDITTTATVPPGQLVRAQFAARKPGVVCGLPLVAATLDIVVGSDQWKSLETVRDGATVATGQAVLVVEAPTVRLLTAERTALNFLSHMSGVATLTSQWVAAVAGTGVKVRDTRKTTPGFRELDKYAVRCGGGVNHRMGLGDTALVKDNHVLAAGGVGEAVAAVRAVDPGIPLEVECDSIGQVQEAVKAGVSLVLLDNMSVAELARVVAWVKANSPKTQLEASGGLTLDSVGGVARTGVDFVAVGALTHSAPVLDLGLDVLQVVAANRLDQ